jgi:hypothetical protein
MSSKQVTLDTLTISQLRLLGKTLGVPSSNKTRKRKSLETAISNTLAKRLCRCERAIYEKDPKKNMSRAIGICMKSVIQNRGLRIQSFQCRGKPSIVSVKTLKSSKTRKQSQ